MNDTSRSSPEADLAFLRSIVQGGGDPRATLTMGVLYLAGGLLYVVVFGSGALAMDAGGASRNA